MLVYNRYNHERRIIVVGNLWLLQKCKNVDEIDALLDRIGLVPDIEIRARFLQDFISSSHISGGVNPLTEVERYSVLKEELASQIWR
jgi:hypothetical protein